MLHFKTYNLTSEQIIKIDDYREKWQEIALSTTKLDRELTTSAINNAYQLIGLVKPEIVFLNTPDEALNYIHQGITANWGKLDSSLGNPVIRKLIDKCLGNLRAEIRPEILAQLGGNLDNFYTDNIALEIISNLEMNWLFTIGMANSRSLADASNKEANNSDISQILFQLFFDAGFAFNTYVSPAISQITNLFDFNRQQNSSNLTGFSPIFTGRFKRQNAAEYELPHPEVSLFMNVLIPPIMADYAYYIDYCHEVLECELDKEKWQVFRDLILNCSWFFPYEKMVIMCDRN